MQKKGTALRRAPKAKFVPPVEAARALPVPDFAPVLRQYYRHDGWTPERQRAFIGALADTGCVRRAARMVTPCSVTQLQYAFMSSLQGFWRLLDMDDAVLFSSAPLTASKWFWPDLSLTFGGFPTATVSDA